MTRPHRGEVWWVEVPTAGRRPALVMTRDSTISVLNRVIVAPATRTIRNMPTEVLLDEDDGMPSECVLSLDSLTVVSKSSLARRIVTLSAERMRDVCAALNAAVAC